MKRAIIIHGWEGKPSDEWLPWVKKQLELAGWRVPNITGKRDWVLEDGGWCHNQHYTHYFFGRPTHETNELEYQSVDELSFASLQSIILALQIVRRVTASAPELAARAASERAHVIRTGRPATVADFRELARYLPELARIPAGDLRSACRGRWCSRRSQATCCCSRGRTTRMRSLSFRAEWW